TSTKAGISTVTASINGTSRTVDVTFIADSSTATIATGNLTIVTNDAVANGTTTNSVKVTVTDANAHPLENQLVTVTADNSAVVGTVDLTDANGEVTVTLTSTKAGISTVTASINGSSRTVDVTFMADTTTATIPAGDLTVVSDDAVADGTDTNKVKAVVKDAQGNVLANQTVSFSAGNGAVIAATGSTDVSGEVEMTLTSTKAGISTVTASINGTSRTVDVTFIADSSTATIATGNLTVVTNDAVANGTATNSVKVKVTDANSHPLENQLVTMTSGNSAVVGTVGLTDANGEVTVTLTSTKAGISTVTASINGTSQTVDVTFMADTTTATIPAGDLTVVSDDAVADGTDTNKVKAVVKDAQGNVLANQTVSFSAGNGAVIAATGSTDVSGEVEMTLTSTKAGISTVTASINGTSRTVDVTFIADSSTATIAT
ncbi:beta strand repeat-containing protein, partial [Buttiauxella gaviniae]|uniref:beta strand repeat-containing protein n=1 Tax=Buttiauxella gaviniae TaxID=82990 RepID=UPI0039769D87